MTRIKTYHVLQLSLVVSNVFRKVPLCKHLIVIFSGAGCMPKQNDSQSGQQSDRSPRSQNSSQQQIVSKFNLQQTPNIMNLLLCYLYIAYDRIELYLQLAHHNHPYASHSMCHVFDNMVLENRSRNCRMLKPFG